MKQNVHMYGITILSNIFRSLPKRWASMAQDMLLKRSLAWKPNAESTFLSHRVWHRHALLTHFWRTGCRIGAKIVSMPKPRALNNAQKCAVFTKFSQKRLGGLKMSRLKPYMGSGNAKYEFPEPRNEHKVRGQIVKNARKRVVFATFWKKTIKSKLKRVWKTKIDGATEETWKTP